MAHSWLQRQMRSLGPYSQQHLYDVKKERLKIQEDVEESSRYMT